MAKKTAAPAKVARKAAQTAVKPAPSKTRRTAAKPANGQASKPALTYQLIAQRAYSIWQVTGNPNEVENWKEAERQLRLELRA